MQNFEEKGIKYGLKDMRKQFRMCNGRVPGSVPGHRTAVAAQSYGFPWVTEAAILREEDPRQPQVLLAKLWPALDLGRKQGTTANPKKWQRWGELESLILTHNQDVQEETGWPGTRVSSGHLSCCGSFSIVVMLGRFETCFTPHRKFLNLVSRLKYLANHVDE